MSDGRSPLLQALAIGKRFGAVPALQAVSLELRRGEVLALVGENGAGKSTLIRILAGALAADAGELRWQGAPLVLDGPAAAARQGIAVVHQEPQLVEPLPALDNLFLGQPFPRRGRWPGLSRREMAARARAAADAAGIALPLQRPVAELSATERTLLALLRCLMRAPKLLILDEPTAALTGTDAQRLLGRVDALRRAGCAVLYVSHRLDEVLQVADRITVLRNGRVVDSRPARGETVARMVEAISGRRDEAATAAHSHPPAHRPAAPRGRLRLQARGLATADGRVRGADLALHAGELLGVYGLAGAGRTELLEALAGLRPQRAATLALDGRAYAPRHAREAAARGVVLIPEDRRSHALIGGRSLRENLALPLLATLARGGWIDRRRERALAQATIRDFEIKATGPEQAMNELSGGNQQKLVLARALAMRPTLLLCDEPTQAVDVATRRAIHARLRAFCAEGGAVLLVSSDLDEMLALAHRVVVLREGRTVAALEGADLSARTVLAACFGAAEPAWT